MGKGSKSSTQTIQFPKSIEKGAEENLEIADIVAMLGMVPNTGATIASFTPQQLNAMHGANRAGAEFDMGNAYNSLHTARRSDITRSMERALTGINPNVKETTGGIEGYSGFRGMQQLIKEMAPAQRNFVESFVMDPITGRAPRNPGAPRGPTTAVPLNLARTPAERLKIMRENARKKKKADADKAAKEAAKKKNPLNLSDEERRRREAAALDAESE